MLRITIGTNHGTKSVVVDDEKTVREVLEAENLNYQTSQVFLGAKCLVGEELDKSFKTYGVGEEALLSITEKAVSGL